jgi:hypothetical protein
MDRIGTIPRREQHLLGSTYSEISSGIYRDYTILRQISVCEERTAHGAILPATPSQLNAEICEKYKGKCEIIRIKTYEGVVV